MILTNMTFRLIKGVFVTLYFFSSMGWSSRALAQESKTISVMSYNIHYGQGMDGRLDLPRIAEIISAQDPDLVGLQEIGDFAMAEKMGRLTGMKFVFGPSLGKKEGYGDAILSKHPFDSFKNYSIPSASSSRYQAMGIDVDLSQVFGRAAKVRFINTHFDWLRTIGSEEARLATVEVIERAFFGDDSLPAILTGDLNATPESKPLERLFEKGWMNENLGKTLNTIGGERRARQIDYVLFRSKQRWNVVDVEVLAEPIASDHLPIVMELEFFPAAANDGSDR